MRIFIVPFYTWLTNKIKKGGRKPRTALRQSPFLIQKKFKGDLIALDTRKNKLLFLKKVNNKPSCMIIDLKDLQHCTINKQYAGINAGELKNKKLNAFLKSIFLDLHFKNSKISLPFFEQQQDGEKDIDELENEAVKWRSFISKILPPPLSKRA
jgi:hypothetical protein